MTKRRKNLNANTRNSNENLNEMLMRSTLIETIHSHEQLRRELRERLFGLKLPTFERLLLDLLRKSGYSNVQLADRMDRRGRTRQGGLDLKAYSRTDLSSALTIAQIKQYKETVPRRFVDELRGTMLRVGAKQGLLMTTSTFSAVARQAAHTIPLLPIQLIDGDALLDLLIERQIGVVSRTVQRLVIDEGFFAALE
jgi:restriction system protein